MLITIAIGAFTYFNKDKIIEGVVELVNSQINAEARVEKVQINFWEHWPYLAVEFQKVNIRGNNCALSYPLLEAEQLSVLSNPIDLFQGQYDIKRIFVKDAQINIYRGKRCSNYEILKKREEGGEVKLSLRNVELKNTKINVHLPELEQSYSSTAISSSFKLDLEQSNYKVEPEGDFLIHKIKIDDNEYFNEENCTLQGNFIIDTEAKRVDIIALRAKLLQSEWTSVAEIFYSEGQNSELFLSTVNTSIANFSPILTEETKKLVKDYSLISKLDLDLQLKGDFQKSAINVLLDFKSKETAFKIPKPSLNFEIPKIHGQWIIPLFKNWQNSRIELEPVKGLLNGSEFSATLLLDNFNSPKISADFYSEQDFNLFSEYLELPLKPNPEGSIVMDVEFNGSLPKSGENLLDKAQVNGTLEIKALQFELLEPNLEMKELNGFLDFDNNYLLINSLSGITSNSDFNLSGSFENFLPYLFEGEKLIVNSKLKSNNIQLEDWISTTEDQEDYVLNLPSLIYQNLELDIKHFRFQRFHGKDIRGVFKLSPRKLDLQNIRMNVAGGSIKTEMNLNTEDSENIDWFIDSEFQNVYIDSIFYIFKNFNQDFIEQRHLRGQINAQIAGYLQSDDHLNFRDEKSIFSINSTIKNGELIYFEPLQDVAKFIKEDDLMDLRFDDLHNEIFIKDKIINIPKMEIHSNVRTISIEGQHGFDNSIYYRLEVPISADKKDKDNRFGLVEDDKTGKAKLLLIMEGTADDYKIKYDKQAAKEKVKEGIKKELNELKDLFKKKKKIDEDESVEIDEDDFFDFN